MKVNKIESFEQLQEKIKELYNLEKQTEVIYRGQADSAWKLSSSLEREILEFYKDDYSKLSTETYTEIKNAHFENVKSLLKNKLLDQSLLSDEEEIWAIGQHFGLKTPLLDWTKSFYNALFFAFNEESTAEYRSVYVLIKPLLRLQEECAKQILIVEPKTDYYQRLTVQQGLFTYWGTETNIKNALQTTRAFFPQRCYENFEDDVFKRFDIRNSPELRDEILRYLKHLGVTYITLYPDLDGAINKANADLSGIMQQYEVSRTG